MLERRNFHHPFTVKEIHTWRSTAGTNQISSAGAVNSLVMLRMCARTKEGYKLSNKTRHKLLRMFKLRRSMFSLHPIKQLQAKSARTDEGLFKNLDRRFTFKVRVGNGNLIEAKGKGNVMISTYSDPLGQELVIVVMTERCFVLNMNQLNLVEDMSKVEVSDNVCEIFQLGKQARLPFPIDKAWKVRDDFSRFCWVYFLKQKSEVEAFSKFKALAENQPGCKIKALRSDNGAQYLSDKFQKLCEQVGIHYQLTTVYTPQQNRVCERKNKSVLDMARCLLFESKLPSKFWAEAVNTLVYMLNKLSTNAVKEKTPFEAWYDLKPTVSHLKVFGCIYYTLIPAEKRTKLEKRFVPRIFVGYSSTKKAYRVFDPSTKKIMVSRDVKFNEERVWNCNGADASLSEEDQINLQPDEEGLVSDDFDDEPVRGTITIADIYQRCDVAIVEPSNFDEAAREDC
ncbi:hypothetical protein CXB51_028743 [Gossypium anomalum]|uniref:Integrase catalytic domain-containing protein n=1 Tax=Gossypium anomalum TaxID=47600 RepID=A0A8J5YHG8_9ROSI|nr:hypothetical protein CXB51_028743 [Gossypium anomalum]